MEAQPLRVFAFTLALAALAPLALARSDGFLSYCDVGYNSTYKYGRGTAVRTGSVGAVGALAACLCLPVGVSAAVRRALSYRAPVHALADARRRAGHAVGEPAGHHVLLHHPHG
jgi:hypothetical protein